MFETPLCLLGSMVDLDWLALHPRREPARTGTLTLLVSGRGTPPLARSGAA